MEQEKVIERIKETAERILPEGASLWLYGSRARGDARPDSDYDLLILIDTDVLNDKGFDNYSYPFLELGMELDCDISPKTYDRKEWNEMDYIPFHDSVENDKKLLLRMGGERQNAVVRKCIEKAYHVMAGMDIIMKSQMLDDAIDILCAAVQSAVSALFVRDGKLANNGKSYPDLFIESYCIPGSIPMEYGTLYKDIRMLYDKCNNDCTFEPDADVLHNMYGTAKEMIDTIAELVKK